MAALHGATREGQGPEPGLGLGLGPVIQEAGAQVSTNEFEFTDYDQSMVSLQYWKNNKLRVCLSLMGNPPSFALYTAISRAGT